MADRLRLHNGRLLAEIVPQAGGGLARLDWVAGSSPQPLLRALAPDAPEVPLPSQLACFPLVPWSNRMAPGGFEFDGRRHVPAPNRAGEPCPIHGDGWQQAWQVESHTPDALMLRLERHAAAPFSYEAALRYALEDDALAVELEVRNAGHFPLPFGLGLHPWLPDPQGARLQARATQVWLSGADKLPSVCSLLPPNWNFVEPSPLPEDGVDNVFEGWDGVADIAWPARGLGLSIEANMDYFILYAPPGRDFFCFEPVDHPINAHNMTGYPGLSILPPGASLRRRVLFRGRAL
ncbi:aldose 1-epimerase [Telluria beijingensis]|uniref:aldose 1-epimerase n=1 Tax=Telluria beijingensis TaxID=3068633 RepID=UPI0027956FB9|nr:aldose 1-epimerase [Massilia sp. REN29]